MTYIVIEGIDGVGKTTVQKSLVERIIKFGLSALSVHDTRGTPASIIMYELVTSTDHHLLPETKLDLFNAARRETLRVVGERISAGQVCVADRSWYSSVAYQGYGEGMLPNDVYHRASEAAFLKADLTIVLDAPVAVAAERIGVRSAKSSWFEEQGAAFFQRVREGFWKLAERDNLPIIYASNGRRTVLEQVWNLVKPLLESSQQTER